MGFWSNLGSAISTGLGEAVSTFLETGSLTKAAKAGWEAGVNDWKESRAKLVEDKERAADLKRRVEEARRRNDENSWKRVLEARQDLVDEFHTEYHDKAVKLENFTKRRFEESYEKFVEYLSDIMDTSEINDFYKQKSKVFKNLMRDEVNSKISIGNEELNEIVKETSVSDETYQNRLNKYAEEVWEKAKEHLLGKLKDAIKETNEFIRSNANQFLKDEELHLSQMNQTRQNLAKEGEERNKELDKLVKEEATLLFISNALKEVE